jgi:hypothetical protein
MIILLYLFAGLGLTMIIVHSKIASRPRDYISSKSQFFKDLLHCSMCSGFYAGIYVAIVKQFPDLATDLLLYPFAISGFAFLFERIAIYIDDLIIKNGE